MQNARKVDKSKQRRSAASRVGDPRVIHVDGSIVCSIFGQLSPSVGDKPRPGSCCVAHLFFFVVRPPAQGIVSSSSAFLNPTAAPAEPFVPLLDVSPGSGPAKFLSSSLSQCSCRRQLIVQNDFGSRAGRRHVGAYGSVARLGDLATVYKDTNC